MQNFDFCAPTRLIFGKDTETQIGRLIKPYAGKLLLHYGGGSIKSSGLYDRVTASLKSGGLDFVELGGVQPNPRLSLVHEGITLCKNEGIDLILAVGGGSVIDSAKAIAMGVYYDGDIWEVYERGTAVERALPVATILTIPAAGSESSSATVITNERASLKYGYGSQCLRPLLSIINPELFFTLSKQQLAYGVADMMSHVFERYFTNTTHTDLTDGLCEVTLKTLMKNALAAYGDMSDYNAWAELGLCGTVAHNDLVGLGRDEDWACHAMEHELSAIYDVAHGAGLAVLTPCWMRHVFKANVNMFARFAVNVMGVDGGCRDTDAVINEGITRLSDFYGKLGLPATLSELGIGEDRLEQMAKKATRAAFGQERPIGGLKRLYWQDVLNIYRQAR